MLLYSNLNIVFSIKLEPDSSHKSVKQSSLIMTFNFKSSRMWIRIKMLDEFKGLQCKVKHSKEELHLFCSNRLLEERENIIWVLTFYFQKMLKCSLRNFINLNLPIPWTFLSKGVYLVNEKIDLKVELSFPSIIILFMW